MASALWRISRFMRRPPPTGAISRLQPSHVERRSNQLNTSTSSPAVVSTQLPAQRVDKVLSSAHVRALHMAELQPESVSENYLRDLTEEQLQLLAKKLASGARRGDVVLLKGDLGVGKSTFARAFIREVVEDSDLSVTSPTYVIEQIYSAPRDLPVHHMDLCRLDGPKEVEQLGLQNSFSCAVCLVEWPDRLGRFVPTRRLDVEVTYSAVGDGRRNVRLRAVGDAWAAKVAAALKPSLLPFSLTPTRSLTAAAAAVSSSTPTSPILSPVTAAAAVAAGAAATTLGENFDEGHVALGDLLHALNSI